MLRKSSRQKQCRNRGRLAVAGIEALEQRFLLSTVSWVGGSGSWNTASNWSSGAIPTSANVVVINQPGNIQVTLTGNASVGSLSVTGDTLSVVNGTLTAATNSSFNASSSLSLSSATLTTASGANLTNSGTISVSTGSDLNVGGTYSESSTGTLTLASGALSNGVGSNLLNNGDFTAPTGAGGIPNGWGNWGPSVISTTYAFSGSQSVLETGANAGVNQSFSATPGTSYTATVYGTVATKLVGNAVGVFNLLFYDANGNQLSGSVGTQTFNSSSATSGPQAGATGNLGWNLFTMTAVAPSNAVTVTVALQEGVYSGSGSGTIYYDDAQFGPTGHTTSLFKTASVSNGGVITVGVGDTLNDTGTFTQTSTGTLNSILGGTSSTGLFGSVVAGGAASLAGKLNATLANGYTPSLNDGFNLLTYSGETGVFTTVLAPSGASYAFQSAVGPFDTGISALPLTTSTTVNIGSVIAAAPPAVVGVNLALWDDQLTTTQTQQMVEAAG